MGQVVGAVQGSSLVRPIGPSLIDLLPVAANIDEGSSLSEAPTKIMVH